jgi:hypothetical protein
MIQKLSIEQYFDTYQQNFNRFKEYFPVTFRAANEINELFWQLYDSYILPQPENSWQYVAHEMVFGCLTGWINSFINSASGLDETAQTPGRRAIEFVCYIAKIRGNDNRADLWIRQRESEETRKQFVQEFSVPGCYFSDNYSRLEKLLFLYESFSIFGTHANISMIALKKKETGTSFEDIVFDEYRYIPKNVDNIIYLGYLLIQSLLYDLSELNSMRKCNDLIEDFLRC